MKHRILLAGKSILLLEGTRDLLARLGYTVDITDLEEGAAKVNSNRFSYSLAVLELEANDGEAPESAKFVTDIEDTVAVLVYATDPSKSAMLDLWRAGAVELVERNGTAVRFLEAVARWCAKHEQTGRALSPPAEGKDSVKAISAIGMVGQSAAMHRLAIEVGRYREKRLNVLILGESGTGKEKVAAALHADPARPFLAVNCASYNGETALMEAELFGAEKGAYTGAFATRKGLFCEADGGTVLLDEVHTLCLNAQQKLLRALQEKKVRPLGSAREIPVAFRLIVAAKPNLEELVRSGGFLPDLFFRLHVLRIDVPPLRERPEDIEPLVRHFCERYCETNGERKEFLASTIRRMERHTWPGNVRELENAVERLCVRTPGEKISPDHLDDVFFEVGKNADDKTFWAERDRITYQRVKEALQTTETQRQAARKLGIPHSTFHGMIQRYGIPKQRWVSK